MTNEKKTKQKNPNILNRGKSVVHIFPRRRHPRFQSWWNAVARRFCVPEKKYINKRGSKKKPSPANCVLALTSSYKPGGSLAVHHLRWWLEWGNCAWIHRVRLMWHLHHNNKFAQISNIFFFFPATVFLSKLCINQINYSVSANELLKAQSCFVLLSFISSNIAKQSKIRNLINIS